MPIAKPAGIEPVAKPALFAPKSSVMSCDVGEEAVLLDAEQGLYFGLDGVGARIWQLIAEGRDVSGMVSAIVSDFDVAHDIAMRDVAAFVDELLEKGLISRLDG
ncbi:MAG: PqqD family protein [Hyphomicrobiaceae bacterium]